MTSRWREGEKEKSFNDSSLAGCRRKGRVVGAGDGDEEWNRGRDAWKKTKQRGRTMTEVGN